MVSYRWLRLSTDFFRWFGLRTGRGPRSDPFLRRCLQLSRGYLPPICGLRSVADGRRLDWEADPAPRHVKLKCNELVRERLIGIAADVEDAVFEALVQGHDALTGKAVSRKSVRLALAEEVGAKGIRVVVFEHAAHVTNVVHETGNQEVRSVAWAYGFAQSTTAENVVPCERDQHGVFQVVVERVGVGDALDRDTVAEASSASAICPWDEPNARRKSDARNAPRSVSGKIGDRNHKRLLARRAPPWRARTLPASHSITSLAREE